MRYIRLAKGGVHNYKLVPDDGDIYKHVENFDSEYYTSIFKYSQDHYDRWVRTGSVAGIKDTTTNLLLFDLDSKSNPDIAREDAITVISRLVAAGFNEKDINVAFSGSKGFHVWVDTNETFTPAEFKTVVSSIAGDLESFDRVVSDSNRLIRLAGTKHSKTGLYKIPLSTDQLKTDTMDQIRKTASSNDVEAEFSIGVSVPQVISALKSPKKEKDTVDLGLVAELDLKKKPKFLDTPRWYLQNGFFGSGERNNAFLCLAATYKNLGFEKEHTYRLLKGVAEIQAKRNNMDRFADVELWKNIIEVVYSEFWGGGQFSSKDENSWLYHYCKKYNIEVSSEDKPLTMVELGGDSFTRYAKSFYETRIYTGLDSLDAAFPICAGSNVAIVGAASSGKCLALNTPIRMFDGSVKMVQDIVVGDKLMGDDSMARTVLSTCKGRENMYEIQQASGMNYTVNESHILSLKRNYFRKGGAKTKEVVDISISDYLKASGQFKKNYRGFHVGVQYSEKKVNIDPYFVGLWLGDGQASGTRIANIDKDVISYLSDLANKYGYKLVNQIKKTSKCPMWNITNVKGKPNLLLNEMRSYNLLDNKHIPKDYLINSTEVRLKLLAGLIDSDGYYDKKSNKYEITFKNEVLAEDTRLLVRSLGFRCTKNLVSKYCYYKGEKRESSYFRLYISGKDLSVIPTLIPRKKAEVRPSRIDPTINTIAVVPKGEGDYYGFEIDGNRRFLLEDYTVTHNTALSLNILKKMKDNGGISVFASLDMSKSRLYEKMLYSVTGGKVSRDQLYQDYLDGKGGKYDELVKEAFPNTYIFSKSAPTVDNMRDYIEKVQDHTGKPVRLLLTDYFERVGSERSDETAASKDVASGIQDLIADFPELTPITLYQPNKFSLGGGPDSPILSYTAIKGSSFIFQAARQIVSLWRPFFTPETKHLDKYMSMAILKNDLGELDKFDFSWEGKTGRITEMDDMQREEFVELMKEKERKKGVGDLI